MNVMADAWIDIGALEDIPVRGARVYMTPAVLRSFLSSTRRHTPVAGADGIQYGKMWKSATPTGPITPAAGTKVCGTWRRPRANTRPKPGCG